MNALRRYEILLPLLFNDGQCVPDALLADTFAELREHFGAASWETQTVRGAWEQDGVMHHDNLVRLFVDVPDLPEHREYFRRLKERLKSRFRQLDIWMTSHPIDVI